MAVKRKLDWLTASTVKSSDSFNPSASHLYIDVKLDLKQKTKISPNRNEIMSSITNRDKDIDVIYDTNCILHSLRELFRTPKGARVLVPEYGTDLYQYIGKSITDLTCNLIADSLRFDIKKWEPRVTILNLNVTQEADNSQINIDLYISIPEISVEKLAKFRFDSTTGNIDLID